jgi:ABC-type phosphate transport system substrate-binding protein
MRHHLGRLTRSALVVLGLVQHTPLFARNDIAVIVSPDAAAETITAVRLRGIYLRKIFLNDQGHPFVPVNLPPDNPLRRGFAEGLLNRSTEQLQDYWNQRYFQGISPPFVLDSQEAVIQFVARTPGAIGYIASCRLDTRVRQVFAVAPPPGQRKALERMCAKIREGRGPR